VDPQIGSVAYSEGDRFLLCSDGLVDGLYDAHLLDLIGSAGVAGMQDDLGQHLVEASVSASGRDNTTALVIEVERF
jgi:serine/threonine protein phosphatase PrpC